MGKGESTDRKASFSLSSHSVEKAALYLQVELALPIQFAKAFAHGEQHHEKVNGNFIYQSGQVSFIFTPSINMDFEARVSIIWCTTAHVQPKGLLRSTFLFFILQ